MKWKIAFSSSSSTLGGALVVLAAAAIVAPTLAAPSLHREGGGDGGLHLEETDLKDGVVVHGESTPAADKDRKHRIERSFIEKDDPEDKKNESDDKKDELEDKKDETEEKEHDDDAHEAHLFPSLALFFALLLPVGAYVWGYKFEPSYKELFVSWVAYILLVPGVFLGSYDTYIGNVKRSEYSLWSLTLEYGSQSFAMAFAVGFMAIVVPINNLKLVCASAYLRWSSPADVPKLGWAKLFLTAHEYTCRLSMAMAFAIIIFKAGIASWDVAQEEIAAENSHTNKLVGHLEIGYVLFLVHAVCSVGVSFLSLEVLPEAQETAIDLRSKQSVSGWSLGLQMFLAIISTCGLGGAMFSGVVMFANHPVYPRDLVKHMDLCDGPMVFGVFLIAVFAVLMFLVNVGSSMYAAVQLFSANTEAAKQALQIVQMTKALTLTDSLILAILLLDVASDTHTVGFFGDKFDMRIYDGFFALLAAELARVVAYFLLMSRESEEA